MTRAVLKVGDKILVITTIDKVIAEIARLTPTMAISKPINGLKYRFKVKLFQGQIKEVGAHTGNKYTLLTP